MKQKMHSKIFIHQMINRKRFNSVKGQKKRHFGKNQIEQGLERPFDHTSEDDE